MTGKYYASLQQHELQVLWNRLPQSESYFGQTDGSSLKTFAKLLARSGGILLYPFGFVRLELAYKEDSLYTHGVFWGKDVAKNRANLKLDLASLPGLFRVSTIKVKIPPSLSGVARFVSRLGFVLDPNQPKATYVYRRI